MTLEQLLATVTELEEAQTVYAKEPWTPDTDVIVAFEPENGSRPAEAHGHAHVLEAFLIKEVLNAWSEHRGGTAPTPREACEAVIHYAQHDAYLMPEA